jgi:deoxycytidylate deaminase
MIGQQCLKQTVIAVIMNNKRIVGFGGNFINNEEVKSCVREGFASGDGYEYCAFVCNQNNHAEVEACLNAGELTKGGTLYLIGHTYACNDCMDFIKKSGIVKVIICDTGEAINL